MLLIFAGRALLGLRGGGGGGGILTREPEEADDEEETSADNDTGVSTELISSDNTCGGMVITGGWGGVSDGQETASDLITLDDDKEGGGEWGEEGGEGWSASSGLGSLEEQTLSLASWLSSSSSSSMSPMLTTLYDRSCSSYLSTDILETIQTDFTFFSVLTLTPSSSSCLAPPWPPLTPVPDC